MEPSAAALTVAIAAALANAACRIGGLIRRRAFAMFIITAGGGAIRASGLTVSSEWSRFMRVIGRESRC
jgi:hypothetical protein